MSVPSVRFSVGTVENLAFKDSLFDAVICKGVLDFVDDEETSVTEIGRVLKPGGTAVVTLLQSLSPWRWWTQHVAALRSPYKKVMGRSYRVGSFTALLSSRGLVTQDVLFCNFQLFPKPLDRLLPGPAVRIASSLERFCRYRSLCWMATGFVVKATKI